MSTGNMYFTRTLRVIQDARGEIRDLSVFRTNTKGRTVCLGSECVVRARFVQREAE